MTDLEEFWQKRVIDEKLMPELQLKGFNMLIHFAKIKYALLEAEEAKTKALQSTQLLI